MPLSSTGAFEWGVATRALKGEHVSGDGHAVVETAGGVLAAVIDGLGHGEEAHDATGIAIQAIQAAPSEDLAAVLHNCDHALGRSRGVVMSLAFVRLSPPTLTWVGVGNVEGYLIRRQTSPATFRERLFLRGGVVGNNLPPLRPASIPLVSGDVLVLVTDGVRAELGDELDAHLDASPEVAAKELLHGFGKETDDALVLFARYRG